MAPMACFTSLMLTAAMVAAPTPVAAADPMGDLLQAIQQEQDRRQFKRAADLAAPASQRTDLRPADRFLLAGLAAESYGEAFQRGPAPRQPRRDPAYLCAQRAVLQEAITLTEDPGKRDTVNDALGKVAAQLAQVAASGRDVPCALAPVVAEAPAETPPAASPPPAEAPPGAAPVAATTRSMVSAGSSSAPTVPTRSPADTRRVQAGVGTLVPGLLLFAPVAVVLVRRDAAERGLQALQAGSAGQRLTDAERGQVEGFNQRYRATTIGAAVLGAVGAALAVTGVVLFTTGPRRSRVAVAPWGARGLGGLVVEGRF